MNNTLILISAVLLLAGLSLQVDRLQDKTEMLIELAEQDMIEYCVNIQPMEMDYDNN